MIQQILANVVGYIVGVSIEGFVILAAGVLLVLMLTGVLFRKREKKPRKQKLIPLNAESVGEAGASEAEGEEAAEGEESAEEAAEVEEGEGENVEEESEPAEAAEAEAEGEAEEEAQPEDKKKKKKDKKAAKKDEELLADDEESAEGEEKSESGEPDVIYVQGNNGVVFNDSKTVTELYEELSNEQKSFFDELREEAMSKPEAELSITKQYISVKIGNKNLVKLLIRKGVTVAEFMLENEALKQFKSTTKNKKGKSSIKVKPTVVQVSDLPSLKVAVDMINLAYEEMTAE